MIDLVDTTLDVTYSCLENPEAGEGNISLDPLLLECPSGYCFLSQPAAGQDELSPCVDTGSVNASELCYESPDGSICMSDRYTRTDHICDNGIADMGFHHSPINAQTPTPSLTYTPSPTPTPAKTVTPTVTPTEEPECIRLGCRIEMPCNEYHPGDNCFCNVVICNPGAATLVNIPVFVILEVSGSYYFAPSFESFDYFTEEIHPDLTVLKVLKPFQWPSGSGSYSGACWYAAMTNPGMTELRGDMDMFEFGWRE